MTAPVTAGSAATAAAELRNGSCAVRIAIAPGAPILSCCLGARDWCEAGPWREYAPTFGACALPSFVTSAPRGPLPHGGALTADLPEVEVTATGATLTIRATWHPTSYPLQWSRAVSLCDEESVRLDYAVTNTHRAPLPFVWGLRVPFAWSDAPAIDVPKASRARLDASCGDGVPRAGTEFVWPALREGGRLVDLSRPTSLGARRSVSCYVELARARVAAAVGGSLLELRSDAGVITHALVLVDNDSDAYRAEPRRWWQRSAKQHTIVAGPAIGAPGKLSDAVGSWNAARWIEPGESLEWTIVARSVTPNSST